MHQVTWIDENGKPCRQEFATWRFANQMAKHLCATGATKVAQKPIRRDVYELDIETMKMWELARNQLLSKVAEKVREFIAESPEMAILIMPPKPKEKPKSNEQQDRKNA